MPTCVFLPPDLCGSTMKVVYKWTLLLLKEIWMDINLTCCRQSLHLFACLV
uniref:Uncharacterized protein n=1 Tax=Anguilla anguilla TaxID=7936 RepID=A0A0E9R3S1_ANGAN